MKKTATKPKDNVIIDGTTHFQARLYYNPEPVPENEPFCIWRSDWYVHPYAIISRMKAESIGDFHLINRHPLREMAAAVCIARHTTPYVNTIGGRCEYRLTGECVAVYKLLCAKILDANVLSALENLEREDVEIDDQIYFLIDHCRKRKSLRKRNAKESE